jgi:hypothetical protein
VIHLLSYSGDHSQPDLRPASTTFSLPQIALGYGALALITTLFTVIAARNPHTSVATAAGHPETVTTPSPSQVRAARKRLADEARG